MFFFDSILSEIKSAVGAENLSLDVPKEKSFGDFATNIAMQIAKSEHRNPKEIAAEMLPKIQKIPFVESAEVAGAGFINIKIKNGFIIGAVNNMRPDKAENPRVLDLDYGAYNVAKELHIGHLRGSIVGDAFYRIAKFLGHRPVSYNHIGDWGKPMALVIAWIMRLFPDDWNRPDFQIEKNGFNGYYVAAAKHAKENPDFLAEVLQIKKEFQDGRPDYFALYEKILDISMADMDYVVKKLNMLPFDNNLGERNAAKYLAPVEKILREKNLLKTSDGATVVELKRDTDTAPMPPFMFYDSRGADTYDSTDLATIYYRKITDGPDKIIYFTDYRQQLHFKQLFRVAEMSGLYPAENLEFPYFGGINGADGRPFKTRDGNVATLVDIIEMVENAAREYAPDLPDETIGMVALAALKFNDLAHDVKSDYSFDPAAVVKFEGRTGPYILYTAVRLNSALKKSIGNGQSEIRDISSEYERDLLLKILEFPKMIRMAFDKRAPDILANYAYDLCQSANAFYHNCPIKIDSNRIAIAKKAVGALSACIDMMGLKIPDEM
ncbi:MAG: arginine--tRNA ligase [Rickettsiales bacterium]|jgi:arginyl-tRNA synthetase|nr:arginine--tRNA ligase [Rickettsiales bacterium]